jgi:hypothetical protein
MVEGEGRAVVIGTILAVALTPVVFALWKRLFPARHGLALLSEVQKSRNARIQSQSVVAGVLMPFGLVLYLGPSHEVDAVVAGMLVGGIFGGALLWVLAITGLRSGNGVREFGEYFESRFSISFTSWCAMSGLALGIGALCLVAHLARS